MALTAVVTILFTFAPLICIRLCELRVEVRAPESGYSVYGGHHHVADRAEPEMPESWLAELQAMLRTLVEFMLAGGVVATLVKAAWHVCADKPVPIKRSISPLPHPPRWANG
jgi:hypothetical protein